MSASSETIEWPNYDPLPTSVDCIRLLHLEPSTKTTSVINCRLTTVTFAERPKYEALSYEWGADTASKTIYLDGKSVKVRRNLGRALQTLRLSKTPRRDGGERILWIDSLCINQQDLEERSRQVRIMTFIYTRAQKVLVWLGNPGVFNLGRASVDMDMRAERKGGRAEGVLLLCRDSYWQRIWIIQEIGVAREIEIHFKGLRWPEGFKHPENGTPITSLSWSEFEENAQEFPELRAAQLIEEKRDRFGDSHLLINLLRNHHSALCHDPRDKIYGLAGLAIDVDGHFPMRYGTPLTEVYSEILSYQNTMLETSESRHDMLEFCQLIGQALKSDNEKIQEEITQIPKPPPGLSGSGPALLRITIQVVGRISCIGPPLEDLIGLQSATIDWRMTLRGELGFDERREALEQNEYFLEMLEGFDPMHQDVVFAFPEIRHWWADDIDRSTERHIYATLCIKSYQRASDEPSTSTSLRSFHLFLLQPSDNPMEIFSLLQVEQRPSLIGLAPPGSEEGDLICQISGLQRALIIRKLGNAVSTGSGDKVDYALMGCSGLAKKYQSGMDDKLRQSQRPWERTTALDAFCRPKFQPNKRGKALDLEINMALAQQLSAPCHA